MTAESILGAIFPAAHTGSYVWWLYVITGNQMKLKCSMSTDQRRDAASLSGSAAKIILKAEPFLSVSLHALMKEVLQTLRCRLKVCAAAPAQSRADCASPQPK